MCPVFFHSSVFVSHKPSCATPRMQSTYQRVRVLRPVHRLDIGASFWTSFNDFHNGTFKQQRLCPINFQHSTYSMGCEDGGCNMAIHVIHVTKFHKWGAVEMVDFHFVQGFFLHSSAEQLREMPRLAKGPGAFGRRWRRGGRQCGHQQCLGRKTVSRGQGKDNMVVIGLPGSPRKPLQNE